MNIKEKLNQPQILENELNLLMELKEEIYDKITYSSPEIKADIKINPKVDTKEDLNIKYIEICDEIKALHKTLIDTKVEIFKMIEDFEPKTLQIMFYRYIKNLKFQDISEETGISECHVFRLHKKALEELERKFTND